MKRKVIIAAAVVIGIGAIAFAYWTISPLLINVRVSEEMPGLPAVPSAEVPTTQMPVPAPTLVPTTAPAPASPQAILGEGQFVGVDGHSAKGTATVLEVGGRRYVRFEENFEITNGPDLFVYLGKGGNYDSSTNLGSLKGNLGSQNYEIPADINLAEYDEVWVWCRAFRVGFGVAGFR